MLLKAESISKLTTNIFQSCHQHLTSPEELKITLYITLHSLDPELVKMTVGCGISHTITKTHIQYI
jgi:hypothetical protein